jgi:hypothetical protein
METACRDACKCHRVYSAVAVHYRILKSSSFNLDRLELTGEIPGIRGNGTAVDLKSGHGFTSSGPESMFETKTIKLINTIT